MENNVMKNMMKWSLRILAAILTISSLTVLTSCSKDDPVIPHPEPQTVVLKGEAAVAWTKDHLDSLVNVYMAECGNLLDPDMTKTILFTMGMYGCGKTTSIYNNPELKKLADGAGVISEGAYNNVKYFEEMVEKSGARGFEPSLLYVYNDAETGYTNCMERLIHSNRAVTCEAYISVFPQFEGRVEYIEAHYPDMKFYCLDNNHTDRRAD